ncbi:MAG: phosphatidylcholine/phosphatidylserine synthase [Planctomycetes bacterium]|nr:phosphatidylcholine/phosphatidylserine synthase [Planctomycetota bacterium]
MKRFEVGSFDDESQTEEVGSAQPPRRRGARAVEMVPTIVTLGNLFSGFLAIAYLTDAMHSPDAASRIQLYEKAVWLIFLAMFFDAVDGWVARRMGSSSDFGAQVDSICDAISFGAAPALLFKVMCQESETGAGDGIGQKFALVLAVGFLACAVLRLARFNLETDVEGDSHQAFEGLPTPAAAAVVASLAYANISLDPAGGRAWIHTVLPYLMPVLAFLMVSRLPYVHAASWVLKRKTFPSLVLLLFLVGIVVLQPEVMVPVLCLGFMAWGPLLWVLRCFQGRDDPIV